jgi:hypothetical protein
MMNGPRHMGSFDRIPIGSGDARASNPEETMIGLVR